MMPNIDLTALERLLRDFSGELESLAFAEVQADPKYQELEKQVKQIVDHHSIVTYLYEGDRKAEGHTITEADLQAFVKYYDFVHERENYIFEKVFGYGFLIGSKLLNGKDILSRKKK